MKYLLVFLLFTFQAELNAQDHSYVYDANEEHPYGLPNPEAAPQITDWEDMIGECDCISLKRLADGTWADSVKMVWRFKYIMNGLAIQDETLKEDGINSGSIRQFNADSSLWYVYYYSSNTTPSSLPVWEGKKIDKQNIILYKEQNAPNGMEGYYKISFSNISKAGFNWLGAWVNSDESIIYPTWQIHCKKRSFNR